MSNGGRLNPDLQFENHGSIVTMRALTDAGRDWIAEHIGDDALMWGDATVIEGRYLADIVHGARDAGLICNG